MLHPFDNNCCDKMKSFNFKRILDLIMLHVAIISQNTKKNRRPINHVVDNLCIFGINDCRKIKELKFLHWQSESH